MPTTNDHVIAKLTELADTYRAKYITSKTIGLQDLIIGISNTFPDLDKDYKKAFIEKPIAGKDVITIEGIPDSNDDSGNPYVSSLRSGAFSGCSNICPDGSKKWKIPGYIHDFPDFVLYNCENLDIDQDSISLTSTYTVYKYAFFNCRKLSLSGPIKIGQIGEYAFSGCTMLALSGKFGCDWIDGNGEGIFKDCQNVAFDSFDPSFSSDSIPKYAFSGCSSVTFSDLPNTLVSIGDFAFRDCVATQFSTIPETVSRVGESAFEGIAAPFGAIEGSSLDYIGPSAFRSNEYLTIPSLPDTVTYIGKYAFYNCKNLVLAKLPPNLSKIEDSAFRDCPNLPLSVLPKNISYIGPSAFSNCAALTLTSLPDYLSFIGEYAFYNCQNIEIDTIPAAVATIGDRAFSDCSSITSITFLGKPIYIDSNSLSSSITTINVPWEEGSDVGGYAPWGASSTSVIHYNYGAP